MILVGTVFGTVEVGVVRSGSVGLMAGLMWSTGITGYYHSDSAPVATGTYYLAFWNVGVGPADGPYPRYTGFSLRCLQE